MGAPARSTVLSDVIDAYLESMESKRQAMNTLRNKRSILRRFLARTGNVQIKNVQPRHVDTYFGERLDAGVQPQSLNNEVATLTNFFDWAARRRYVNVQDNPMMDRGAFDTDVRPRTLLPVDKFAALLDAAHGPRDRIVCSFGLYMFLRQSEIKTLRVRDVDLDGGWINLKIHKTKEHDRMPISAELHDELEAWLSFYKRDQRVFALDPDWLLVPAKHKVTQVGIGYRQFAPAPHDRPLLKPTTPMVRIERCVQRALADIGVPLREEGHAGKPGKSLHEGVHTLRASGARAYFDERTAQGYDGVLRELMAMLHHKTASTTEHYIGITLDKRKRDENVRGKRMYTVRNTAPVLKIAEGN